MKSQFSSRKGHEAPGIPLRRSSRTGRCVDVEDIGSGREMLVEFTSRGYERREAMQDGMTSYPDPDTKPEGRRERKITRKNKKQSG